MQDSSLKNIHPKSLKHLDYKLINFINQRLWLKVVIGLLLGIITGIIMGPSVGIVKKSLATSIGNWLALPGQVFLTMVQMIVIPLIFASIIRGLAASENIEQLKKIGFRIVLFFVITTAISAFIGICISLLIKPGSFINSEVIKAQVAAPTITPKGIAAIGDIGDLPEKVITILPGNPLVSMVEGQMLEVVIFALLVGLALVAMTPKQSKPMLDLLGSLQEICMTVVRWAMVLVPYAVFGLIAQLTMKIGFEVLLNLAMYAFTVIFGLFLVFLVYLVILYSYCKITPKHFIVSAKDVLLLAFSTSSSATVMPLSIKTAESKLKVRPSVSQIVIPLGTTINMNGTALYQSVATIFLSQVFGIDLGIGAYSIIIILAIGASIGSPGTPGVGIIILVMILSSVGIPPSGVALIMGLDRILDMCRTVVNVAGDLVASKVMDKSLYKNNGLEKEIKKEKKLDKLRDDSGDDVLIDI